VKPHSVFLRAQCVLPNDLNLIRNPFNEAWTLAEELTAPALDATIRRAGWHFMWIQGSYARNGFSRTQEVSIHRALEKALAEVPKYFNAAELDCLQVSTYPGFHIASATLHARQIQRHATLDVPSQEHPKAVVAG
jgi:hypothetical protein